MKNNDRLIDQVDYWQSRYLTIDTSHKLLPRKSDHHPHGVSDDQARELRTILTGHSVPAEFLVDWDNQDHITRRGEVDPGRALRWVDAANGRLNNA